MRRAPGRSTRHDVPTVSALGWKRAAASMALVGALGALLLTCARDTTGPALSAIQITIEGPTTVGVTQDISLNARVPQAGDPTRVRITWRASDTSLVHLLSAGLSTTVHGRRIGEDTITAVLTAPDLPVAVSQTHVLTVEPGPPWQLLITTQPSAAAEVGKPLAQQPVLQVADSGGNAVATAGVRVAATLATGTGTLANDTAVSEPSGAVPFAGLAVTATVGTYALQFNSVGSTLAPAVSSPITLAPGDASRLVVKTQPPDTVKAGVVFGPPSQVQVADAGGNAVAQANLTVTARVTSGPASVTAAGSATTDDSGTATFAGMVVGGTAAPSLTLTFTTGPFSATSNGFVLDAGDPAALRLASPLPDSARSGVPIGPAPQVRIVDAYDNTVRLAGATIVASKASGAGTLGGTTTANTDSSGIATFTNLILSGPLGPYTVTFSPTGQGWQPVTSGTITLGFGPAAALVFTVEPSNAAAGQAITPAVRVAVYDTTGNVNTNATNGIKLTLGANPGSDVLGGTDSLDAVNGVAVFTDLSLHKSASGYTLVASSSALASATSVPFTVTPGAASQLVANSPTTLTDTVGTPVTAKPSVRVTDPFGNGVPGVQVVFNVTGGGGSATGGSQATDIAGVATVGGWTLGTAAGPNTMTATAGTLAGSPMTFTVTAQPGPPSAATSVVTAGAGTVQAGANIVILLVTRDQYGNALTSGGASVAFTRSGGTSTGIFGTTVDSGNGSYTAPFTGATAGTATTIGATIGGTAVSTPLPTVTVIPGPPSVILATAGDGLRATIGTATQVPPVVTVRDAYDNAVAGVGVTFAVTGGGGSVSPTTPVTTDAAGKAAADRWILGIPVGDNALTATAGSASRTFTAVGTFPTLLTTVPLGDAYMGRSPAGIGVNPATNRVYVANASSNTVTVLDGSTDNPVASIPLASGPTNVAVNATTNRIYVVLSSDQLAVINGATNAVTGTVSFPAASSARGVAVNEGANRIYVTLDDNNAIAVVDGGTLTYTTITGIQDPRQIAFNPSTGLLYLTHRDIGGNPEILVYDAATNAQVTSIRALGGIWAENIAADPAANRIYFSGLNPSIGVIDGSTNTLLTTIPVITSPPFSPPTSSGAQSVRAIQALGVDPTSHLVYATSDSGTLAIINGATGSVAATLRVGSRPSGVAANPSTGKWYASLGPASAVLALPGGSTTINRTLALAAGPTGVAVNRTTGEIWVANAASNNVLVLDGTTHGLLYALPAGTTPAKVAVNAATNRAYIASSGADSVTVLDGAAHVFLRQVAVGTAPMGVAVIEGTNRIYVGNSGSGSISVIDGATGTVSTTLPLGSGNPTDLAVGPGAAAVFVCQDDQNMRRLDIGTGTFSVPVYTNGYCDYLAVNGRNELIYPSYRTPAGHGVSIFDAALAAVPPSTIPLSLTVSALAADPVTGVVLAGMPGETDVLSGDLNVKVGQLNLPGAASGLAVNPANGRFYLTDATNGRLQVIQQ
jgi:YVTN family beta-propeller protein